MTRAIPIGNRPSLIRAIKALGIGEHREHIRTSGVCRQRGGWFVSEAEYQQAAEWLALNPGHNRYSPDEWAKVRVEANG